MSRKQPKRTAGKMALSVIAGFFIFAIVGSVGLGVASADPDDELARAGAFGFDPNTHATTQAAHDTSTVSSSDSSVPVVTEQSVLTATSSRNVESGMKMIDEKERAEQERIAAENAAAIERMEAQKAMQGVVSQPVATQPAQDSAQATEAEAEVVEEPVMEYNLPAVDWTVGKEVFVAEWSGRIDAYLAGSPLSGYGPTFAEAAWDNGVDPRWSPAISNTESSKGAVCFMSHNAWGWGASAWGDWDTAIRSHVAGLASGYGYSLTLDAAYAYCPPHAVDWYNKTLAQMASI